MPARKLARDATVLLRSVVINAHPIIAMALIDFLGHLLKASLQTELVRITWQSPLSVSPCPVVGVTPDCSAHDKELGVDQKLAELVTRFDPLAVGKRTVPFSAITEIAVVPTIDADILEPMPPIAESNLSQAAGMPTAAITAVASEFPCISKLVEVSVKHAWIIQRSTKGAMPIFGCGCATARCSTTCFEPFDLKPMPQRTEYRQHTDRRAPIETNNIDCKSWTVARRRHPVDYVNLKLLAVRCEAATPVNVTLSFAS